MPQDADELLAAIRTYLQQAKLSVHMFGKKYGARPDSEDRSMPHIQYDLAAELNKEQLIWLPKEIVPENERQLQFVEHVRKQSRDWQENKLEDFKSEVLKRLKREPALDHAAAETESVNICLFFHEDDGTDISPLFSFGYRGLCVRLASDNGSRFGAFLRGKGPNALGGGHGRSAFSIPAA